MEFRKIHFQLKLFASHLFEYLQLPKMKKTKKLVITKLINKKLYSNRDELLSIYSLLYIKMQRDFGENISKKISDKTKYKESYIKNLTKDCFSKAYMKNSNKGLAGGILTNKALRVLSHL